MVRTWAATATACAIAAAGCSSNGSSALPKLDRKDWTPAGMVAVNAAAAKIAAVIPGGCANPGPNDFTQFPISMKRFHSKVVPLGQALCDADGETLELSVFASATERDRYIDDRSIGICKAAAQIAKETHKPLVFSGLRWVAGNGNLAVQPDSESLARKVRTAVGGSYISRPCAPGITTDWDATSVTSALAVGAKITGCTDLKVVGRETLLRTRQLTNAQLPAALATCTLHGGGVAIVTFSRRTSYVDDFVKRQVTQGCGSDPALGRIDGDGYVIVASGNIAEQVAKAVGNKPADGACAALTTTTT